MGTRKRITVTNVNQLINISSVFSDNLINHLLRSLILIRWSFHKNIPSISVFNFFLCYLNFGSTFHLKLSYSITTLTYNEPYAVIWNWDNVCIGRRRSIGSHHTVIHRLISRRIIDLLSNHQLFSSDFVSCAFIS